MNAGNASLAVATMGTIGAINGLDAVVTTRNPGAIFTKGTTLASFAAFAFNTTDVIAGFANFADQRRKSGFKLIFVHTYVHLFLEELLVPQ
jgi:hypothetical protein